MYYRGILFLFGALLAKGSDEVQRFKGKRFYFLEFFC